LREKRMNSADRPQLQRVLYGRCEEIAGSWHRALASTPTYVPLKAAEVRQSLVELTQQFVELLLAEPFDHDQAQQIGAALARLRYIHSTVLGQTLEILAHQFMQDLSPDQVVTLQPRLATLLGELAAGFCHQAREIILAEQEEIGRALVGQLQAVEKALREAHDSLEVQVEQRTAELLRANEELRLEVAQRKRAEEALRESRQLLERTFVSLDDAVFIIDADSVKIVECNPAASEIFGYSRDEMVGRASTLLHVDEAALEEFRGYLYPAIETKGFLSHLEFRMKRKDGTVFPTEHSVRPLEDERDNRIGWVSVVCDITTRKRAEEALQKAHDELEIRVQERTTELAEANEALRAEVARRERVEQALRESEERARALLNASTDVALLLDPDGIVVALNEAAARSMDESPNELVGICAYDLFPPDVAERRKSYANRVLRSGKPVRFEDEREGRRFDHTVYPVLNAQGKVVQLAIFARDITERRRAEQLATQAERLAAMGWLAAAIAHEINNPLQAIQTNLELALDFDLEPDEHAKHLDVVRQEIERMAEITRRVLDLARPADDTRYPVSIAHMVEKTLKLVGKQLELAHIYVTTDFPIDLPPAFVAPDQIIQVLLNLSANAIEAMSDGGRLHVTARADENRLELVLTNDGPPLSAEHIEHIFDPFFTTKPKGTGLGLTISHNIIHRHGGEISVENLKGDRGVAFTITLPIARLGTQGIVA
jgi:PAS domain S-box-containing protein